MTAKVVDDVMKTKERPVALLDRLLDDVRQLQHRRLAAEALARSAMAALIDTSWPSHHAAAWEKMKEQKGRMAE